MPKTNDIITTALKVVVWSMIESMTRGRFLCDTYRSLVHLKFTAKTGGLSPDEVSQKIKGFMEVMGLQWPPEGRTGEGEICP